MQLFFSILVTPRLLYYYYYYYYYITITTIFFFFAFHPPCFQINPPQLLDDETSYTTIKLVCVLLFGLGLWFWLCCDLGQVGISVRGLVYHSSWGSGGDCGWVLCWCEGQGCDWDLGWGRSQGCDQDWDSGEGQGCDQGCNQGQGQDCGWVQGCGKFGLWLGLGLGLGLCLGFKRGLRLCLGLGLGWSYGIGCFAFMKIVVSKEKLSLGKCIHAHWSCFESNVVYFSLGFFFGCFFSQG